MLGVMNACYSTSEAMKAVHVVHARLQKLLEPLISCQVEKQHDWGFGSVAVATYIL